MNEESASQKRSWLKTGFFRWLVTAIVLFDLYCLSLFVLVKPCDNLRMLPFDIETIPSPRDGQPVFPDITWVCVFENEYNVAAYYFYWPLHRALEICNYWHFVKNPQTVRVRKWPHQVEASE